MQHDMKSINLFGQEVARVHESQKVAKKYFRRLRGLCGKIQSQETTDDCYTPPAVYDYVLQYVADHCDIDGMTVVPPVLSGVVITRAWSIPIIAW